MIQKLIIQIAFVFALVVGFSFIRQTSAPPSIPLVERVAHVYENNDPSKSWVESELKKLSLRQRIAQSFMVPCWSNKGERHLESVEELVREQEVGGVIFFQGESDNLYQAINQMESASKLPLLIGMDAEWGVAMRLFGESRFPYQQTIGAADDAKLTEELAYYMGVESGQFQLHFNFSPVADVNINPKNPVIGYRAFGSDPVHVAKHTAAMVRGFEKSGILSCLKHFPGHGDTDKDSHYELPTVSHSIEQFEQTDFLPFKEGIQAGASAVMVAHLRVPSLDPSGMPSSLSKPIIETYLRKKLGFKGLVISDALNMKAVADRYGKSEVVAMAYEAGCDVLLFPESVSEAIDLILKKVKKGDISEAEVDDHCRRVLKAKYDAIIAKPMIKRMDPNPMRQLLINQTYEKALVCLKNEENHLPYDLLNKRFVRIAIGTHTSAFRERLDDYASVIHYKYFTPEEACRRLAPVKLPEDAEYIIDLHTDTQRASSNYGFGSWKELFKFLPENAKVTLIFFGNPLVLEHETDFPTQVKSVLCAYENSKQAQERTAQAIMGAFDVKGKLAISLNEHWKIGFGVSFKGNGRLKYSQPEELGIRRAKLAEIDDLVEKAIIAKAFPGCQVVVAVKGKIILQKSYGKTMYEQGDSVTNKHIYDLASITKIASTTTALMHLQSQAKFGVEKRLQDLVPEYVSETPYAKLKSIDLLTHQAGLTAWIPFYKRTMTAEGLDETIYSSKPNANFSVPVAPGIWIRNDYWKTMLKLIVEHPLSGKKSYEYSDLSYYFFSKYIEKVSGMPQNEYLAKEIYQPLGLKTMTYLPLEKFPLSRIVPTEYDKEFRKQLIQGYVHDPGAAMMGGVAGHAGLFSNATDLAALMQFLLNKGQIGDQSLIKEEVVQQYTACQFCPDNRRGIGFDKPTVGLKKGPTSELVSPSTFGHSGFTGTITWADPENEVTYVFLSNRVYPDADNWKITKMSVRNEIQRIVYEALNEARSNK